jgi:hypothetical protein
MWGPSILLAVLLCVPALAAGPQRGSDRETHSEWTASGREEMELVERHLEEAVGRVSLPHAGILLGRANASRGYRLPGYGVVFVLTPRALPGNETVYVFRGHPGMERAHPGPHREVEIVTTSQVEEIEALERQVLILQHAAEARRRAAEEDHERIVRRVRIHLAPVSEAEAREGEPEPVDETAPLPTGGPTVPPPPPPWRFWFETERPKEERTPERVVEDVREAVIEVLESRGAGVVGLEADEFVTVAVDFVPGDFFAAHPRPTRTLIVRARQKDLAARARGAMAPGDLRARVEVIEY